MKDNATKIGGAFLLGGVIGAAIALLYAPRSGKETRQDISKTARRIKSNAVDLIEETIEDVHGFADNLKEKTGDVIEQGMNLSDKAKKDIVTALEHGQRVIEKQRKRLTQALGL